MTANQTSRPGTSRRQSWPAWTGSTGNCTHCPHNRRLHATPSSPPRLAVGGMDSAGSRSARCRCADRRTGGRSFAPGSAPPTAKQPCRARIPAAGQFTVRPPFAPCRRTEQRQAADPMATRQSLHFAVRRDERPANQQTRPTGLTGMIPRALERFESGNIDDTTAGLKKSTSLLAGARSTRIDEPKASSRRTPARRQRATTSSRCCSMSLCLLVSMPDATPRARR